MVLRHAAERFRLAYELPLDTSEFFGEFEQFTNVTLERLDENSYRSEYLSKHDLWRSSDNVDDLLDYKDASQSIYDNNQNEDEVPDYDDQSSLPSLYQWHRDRHFDMNHLITKYIDDKT
jgi:hypothetical protein